MAPELPGFYYASTFCPVFLPRPLPPRESTCLETQGHSLSATNTLSSTPRSSKSACDEEKKKYFKIQANHEAPRGGNYTRDDVKRRKYNKAKSKQAAKMAARQSTERIRRSYLSNPLCRVYEETGSIHMSRDEIRDRRARQSVLNMESEPLYRFYCPSEHYSVVDIYRDRDIGTLIQVVNYPSGGDARVCYPTITEIPGGQRWDYQRNYREWSFRTPSRVTHMLSAMQGNPLTFIPKEIFSSAFNRTNHLFIAYQDGHEMRIMTQRIPHPDNVVLSLSERSTVGTERTLCRAAASERTGTTPDFAIASTEGLMYLSLVPHGVDLYHLWDKRPKPSIFRTRADYDVHAVDFVTPDLIATGGAGKNVILTDKRSSGNDSIVFDHDTPISYIKAVDDHQVLVTGQAGRGRSPMPEDTTICLYDLRYSKKKGPQTVPYWETPFKFSSPKPKMDVCPELGLLAAVDDQAKPQLLSLRKGSSVPSSITQEDRALTVKFDERNGNNILLVGTLDGVVKEFS
ncbi:unnamed protein product [Penicillium olsonii]|nr:unnamed protein product [Penicillium olsonii]